MSKLTKKATKAIIRDFIHDIHSNLLETLDGEGLSIVEYDPAINIAIYKAIKINFQDFLERYDLSLSEKDLSEKE